MKKTFSMFLSLSTLFASFAFVLPVFAIAPTWDTTGNYVVTMNYLGNDYNHDVALIQDGLGNLTGNGGSPAGANVYTWVINSGTVVGNSINFTADYTATPDAVTPQTTITVAGIIALDGTMSGTWSDNYNNTERSGTWTTVSGAATSNDSETVTVTIEKYVEGAMATAASASNADFEMTATWNASNIGAGTGDYVLSETNTIPYQAVTAPMTKGADYETKEVVSGEVVGAQCTNGKPFALLGYTSGNTKDEALAETPSMAMPSFSNLQQDKFVIVWNSDCALEEGEIGGEVIGNDGVLEVTSIDMIDTSATANGSFSDGWKYVFHITAPTSEQNLAMKFNDWMRTGGGGTITVANHMRISSLQADNGGATILLTAANTYSTPDLHLISDLDPVMDGRQVMVVVEVAIPAGTPNGAYTTAYGVQSNP